MTDTLPELPESTPVMPDAALPAVSETVAEVSATPATEQLPDAAAESAPEPAPDAQAPAAKPAGKVKNRFADVQPVLEKLFELYPQLFGQRFLPLKLGVFQELLAAHPEDFKRDSLKAALGVHTRSTRYLQSVAAGNARHDLQGKPVEPVAPEHIYLSILELFHRRQARTQEDLKPKLFGQLARAYEASGLTRQADLSRLPAPDEQLGPLLDAAMEEVDQHRARRAALVRAFEASGQSVQAFADAMGMDVASVEAALPKR